jgi:hypothetical protein
LIFNQELNAKAAYDERSPFTGPFVSQREHGVKDFRELLVEPLEEHYVEESFLAQQLRLFGLTDLP